MQVLGAIHLGELPVPRAQLGTRLKQAPPKSRRRGAGRPGHGLNTLLLLLPPPFCFLPPCQAPPPWSGWSSGRPRHYMYSGRCVVAATGIWGLGKVVLQIVMKKQIEEHVHDLLWLRLLLCFVVVERSEPGFIQGPCSRRSNFVCLLNTCSPRRDGEFDIVLNGAMSGYHRPHRTHGADPEVLWHDVVRKTAHTESSGFRSKSSPVGAGRARGGAGDSQMDCLFRRTSGGKGAEGRREGSRVEKKRWGPGEWSRRVEKGSPHQHVSPKEKVKSVRSEEAGEKEARNVP